MTTGRSTLGKHGASLLTTIAIVVATIAIAAPSAAADLSLCPPGSGAGQCENPQGVDVNRETGDFYVVDPSNNRIDVFDSTGAFVKAFGWGVADGTTNALQTCTATCFKGISGSGPGQLANPRRIAIDNSGGPDQGAVYVGPSSARVQKFSPAGAFILAFGWDVNKTKVAEGAPQSQRNICTAASENLCGAGVQGSGEGQFGGTVGSIVIGPGGVVYVPDKLTINGADLPRIEKFQSSGAFLELLPLSCVRPVVALAVDSGGDFYVHCGGGGIRKLNPAGVELGAPYPLDPGIQTTALATDASGNLYAGHSEAKDHGSGQSFKVITAYDSAGNHLSRFGYGAFESNVEGIAPFHSPGGDVFATEPSSSTQRVKYISLPAPGPIAPTAALTVSAIGSSKATLEAEVNPEGKASEYRFQYVDQQSFEADGFVGSGTVSTPLAAVPVPAGQEYELHFVQNLVGCPDPVTEAELPGNDCLLPETTYHFRVIATNADGSDEVEGQFATKPSLEILAGFSSEVGVDTAKVSAEVNPLGVPATGWFQYVEQATCEKDEEELGAGHCFDHATQVPDVGGGEEPIEFGAAGDPITVSTTLYPLKAATAYRYRALATDPLLPEPLSGPAYTFTTFAKAAPPGTVCNANQVFRIGAAAFLPDCRAYELVSPLDKNSGDITVRPEGTTGVPATLEQSAVSGQRLAYGSYRAFADAASAPYTIQYVAARSASGWSTHAISPPRTTLVLPASQLADTELKALSPDLCSAWIRTVADPQMAPEAVEGFVNLYRRSDEECGGEGWEAITTVEPPTVGPKNYAALEPQGSSADGGTSIYVANDKLTADAPQLTANDIQLYVAAAGQTRFVCILPNGEASELGCSAGEAQVRGDIRRSNLQNAISADGSRVFWTGAAAGGGSGAGKIYLRENPFGSGPECADASSPCTIAVSAEAEARSGTTSSEYRSAADDGSKAIFITGKDLYEFEVAGEATNPIAHKVMAFMGASEDASHVYFVSEEALGAANSEGRSAQAGKANLYLYRAGIGTDFIGTLSAADASLGTGKSQTSAVGVEPFKRSSRISPDGTHAAFMAAASLTGYDNTDAQSGEADAEMFVYDAVAKELTCVSCNPTGGRPAGRNIGGSVNQLWAAASIRGWQNALYADRALSDDGRRLFFQSTDTLSPRDTNGLRDVYQWEAVGKGDCSEANPSFTEQNEGCISLISSGQSDRDSEFRDASASGEDVFIGTLESLVPKDYGLVDIYDARVGGGLAEAVVGPECEADSCQSPALPPNDQTPASASFHGAGNPPPSSKARCPKGKRAVRRKGKARCVKAHKRQHKRTHSNRRAAR